MFQFTLVNKEAKSNVNKGRDIRCNLKKKIQEMSITKMLG